MNRRTFIRGSVAVAPAAVALQAALAPASGQDRYGSDIDILNFALIAEYFLSRFYREGGPRLEGKERRYIQEIGADEDAHIAAITQTIQNLGGTPAQAPAIDYKDALSSRGKFLRFGLRFENLFAGAYLGAAGAVDNPDILQAAAGIYGTEERHAAIVGELLGLPIEGGASSARARPTGVFQGATGRPASKQEVLAELRPYLVGARGAAGSAAVTR
jgi:ferritin-like protein